MKRSDHAGSEGSACPGPVPDDLRRAIAVMRATLRDPPSMADLSRDCGVAERTLNEHFRMFLGMSPLRYLRRLRLAAVREALLSGNRDTTITELARRYGFNHAGRFAEQYRRQFGVPPSATLRRAQAAANLHRPQIEKGEPRGPAPATWSREKPTIAIVLGAAQTNEPSLRWFAEALAEAVAADLSSIRSLAVLLPRAALAGIRDPQRLARESGARYVLAGRIVQDGGRLRFILRIAETASGHHVWGDSFDGDADRPLALLDRTVRGLRRGIVPGIRGAEIDRASRRAPRDLDAYGLAMRALPLLYSSTQEGARRALESLDRAVEIDPDYGLAAALAAWGHGQLVMYNASSVPAEARDRSSRLARRAAVLDDDDPLALTARCAVHMMLGELDAARTLVSRALARDPTCGWAWGRSGWLHAYKGESDTAIAHFRRALRLGPVSSRANIFVGIGSAHFNAASYAAAASWIGHAMRAQPELTWANRSLAVSYARLGEPQKARESLAALRRFNPDLTVSQVVTAVPFRPDFLDRLGDGLSALGLPP